MRAPSRETAEKPLDSFEQNLQSWFNYSIQESRSPARASYNTPMDWKWNARPKLISIQVGAPRLVQCAGEEITTSIFKTPVNKRIPLHQLNLEGDKQSDLSVHGGRDKTVYAYPSENYPYWKKELPSVDLPWGAFGENFTTAGLLEDTVYLGDRFTIGTAEVVVTQPRIPCFKLNLKFGRDDMAKRFLASRRSGFYLRVLREGEVGPGDKIVRIHQDENKVSIADAMRVYLHEPNSNELARRALQVEYLSKTWRERFTQTLYPHQQGASPSE
jgi:MOSC domain-containing protein YiiM